jgi:hypothetical protein
LIVGDKVSKFPIVYVQILYILDSRTEYTMLVNAADRLKMPATLQTLFHLKSDELSVMMWLRVHMVNSEVPLGTVFALVA